jgi:hypothetical protein
MVHLKEHFGGLTLVRTLGVTVDQWTVYLDGAAGQPGRLIGEVVFDPEGLGGGTPRTWLAVDLAGIALMDAHEWWLTFGSRRKAAEALKRRVVQP